MQNGFGPVSRPFLFLILSGFCLAAAVDTVRNAISNTLEDPLWLPEQISRVVIFHGVDDELMPRMFITPRGFAQFFLAWVVCLAGIPASSYLLQ